MRYTAPFLAATFILVWLAPQHAGDFTLFMWMLVSMVLYDGCYTMIGLVYSALLPEVTESDTERNHLQISSSLFGLLGTLLGFIIPDLFRPKAGAVPSFFPLQIAMVVVGVTGMLLIIATTFKVKERLEFTQLDKPLKLIDQIKFTFTSKSFLILVSQNFMSILVSSLVTGSVFYLADYVLKMNTIVLLAFIFIPLIGGVPITNIIRKKMGLVQAQQLLLVIAGVGLIAITFVPTALIPICLLLVGFGLSGPQTLTNILFRRGGRRGRAAFRRAPGGRFLRHQCPDHQTRPIAGDRDPAFHPGSRSFCHPGSQQQCDLPQPARQRNLRDQGVHRADPRHCHAAGRADPVLVPAARRTAGKDAARCARTACQQKSRVR